MVSAMTATQAFEGVFDPRAYGAVGDGQASDTAAINAAVEACVAAGGGQVRLSPGVYLTGTVRLRSGVCLYLEAGAVLRGSVEPDDYEWFETPEGSIEARKTSNNWHRALILIAGQERVQIAGPGTIDGNRVHDPSGEERMRGPHTVIVGSSRDVVIRDVRIVDSANYAVMVEFSKRVSVDHVTIEGGWDGVHFRGMPEDPCEDLSVTHCRMHTGDDAIAGRFVRRMQVTHCTLNSSCNAVRVIGPAEELLIHGCLIYGPGRFEHRTSGRTRTLAGISLQPGAWDPTGGPLDRVLISDITMHNVATPLFFTLHPENTGGSIEVNRVHATGVYRAASSIESWASGRFASVALRDVTIAFDLDPEESVCEDGAPVKPRHEVRPLPVWGFYARGIDRLTVENLRLSMPGADPRTAIGLDGIGHATLDHVKLPTWVALDDALARDGVEEIAIREMRPQVKA